MLLCASRHVYLVTPLSCVLTELPRSGTEAGRGVAVASSPAFAFCGVTVGVRSGFWLLGVGFFGGRRRRSLAYGGAEKV